MNRIQEKTMRNKKENLEVVVDKLKKENWNPELVKHFNELEVERDMVADISAEMWLHLMDKAQQREVQKNVDEQLVKFAKTILPKGMK